MGSDRLGEEECIIREDCRRDICELSSVTHSQSHSVTVISDRGPTLSAHLQLCDCECVMAEVPPNKIESVAGYGRVLVAARDISPWELVLEDTCLVVTPCDVPVCLVCLGEVTSSQLSTGSVFSFPSHLPTSKSITVCLLSFNFNISYPGWAPGSRVPAAAGRSALRCARQGAGRTRGSARCSGREASSPPCSTTRTRTGSTLLSAFSGSSSSNK